MKLHYNQNHKLFARKLRQKSTVGEVLLWRELKGKKLQYQFLRQVPIEKYIVDFYCHSLHLAIEIDGAASHNQKIEQDEKRQKEIEKQGIKIVRFSETNVRDNLEGVLTTLKFEIMERIKSLPATAVLPLQKGD